MLLCKLSFNPGNTGFILHSLSLNSVTYWLVKGGVLLSDYLVLHILRPLENSASDLKLTVGSRTGERSDIKMQNASRISKAVVDKTPCCG